MGYLLGRVIYEIREDVLLTNTNDHLDPYFIHQIYMNLLCTSVKISLDIPNVYLNLTELEVYDNYYQATFIL